MTVYILFSQIKYEPETMSVVDVFLSEEKAEDRKDNCMRDPNRSSRIEYWVQDFEVVL